MNQCMLMFFRYDLCDFFRLRRSEGGTLEGGKSTLGLEGGTLQQGVLLHLAKGGYAYLGGTLNCLIMVYFFQLFVL